MGAYCTVDSLINVPLFNNSNAERYHFEVKKTFRSRWHINRGANCN